MHIGRHWAGHATEDTCPCPKAPCGLVDASDYNKLRGCPEHDILATKTMRQIHAPGDCPMGAEAWAFSERLRKIAEELS